MFRGYQYIVKKPFSSLNNKIIRGIVFFFCPTGENTDFYRFID